PSTSETITDSRARTLPGKRLEYTRAAVMDPPEATPGTKVIYGGGPIIAASHAERVTKVPFEQMISAKLFKPLRMNRARFGTPASPGSKASADGPWEHDLQGGTVNPIAPDPTQSAQTRSPVGRNICCSVADLGRFAAVHLQGARGKSKF